MERGREDWTNIFQKDLENTSGLFVDQTGDTFDATSTSETTDGGLGNTLDVVAKDLAMTLCATLSETLKIKSVIAELKGKTIRRTFPPLPRPDIV